MPKPVAVELRGWVEQVSMLLERDGLPRMAGRIFGWLLVCDPPEQSMEDLAAAVQGSKASMSTMTRLLVQSGLVEKVRTPGARRDQFRVQPGQWQKLWRSRIELIQQATLLTGRGLELLAGKSPALRARLEELHRQYRFFGLHFPELLDRLEREWPGRGCSGRPPHGRRGIGARRGASRRGSEPPGAVPRGNHGHRLGAERLEGLHAGQDRGPGAARRHPGHRAGGVPLHRRSVRQRQDHPAQPDRLRGHRHRRHRAGGRARTPGSSRSAQLTDLRLHTIGFIFQSFNLVQVLSVFQNVEFPLLLQGKLSRREREARVMGLLEAVGIGGYRKHRPSELSGGQRQRVAVARALVTRPALVLADEPTANLDSQTGATIIDLMKEMNHRDGTTFIFSTHDPKVMSHASAVIRIADGRLVGREELNGAAAAGGK